MIALAAQDGEREGIGDLARGRTHAAAERLGKDLSDMLVEVKGVEVPMHDSPWPSGRTRSTTRGQSGACHMEG